MDQEFSSNVLADHQIGWDWLSLQLDDGRDVMVFRLRNEAGETDYASATLIERDGTTRPFPASAIRMIGSDPWTSPRTGGAYPQRWAIDIDGFGRLNIRSTLSEQELVTTNSTDVSYFEGAVEAIDDAGNVIGRGYLELTGYAQPLRGGF
ncbi:MAG TPA: lipocalin family protein [Tepidisphaeraceae bacterium]|nr:lipocalin family protein [Tepidisphaeraceae bacterium]